MCLFVSLFVCEVLCFALFVRKLCIVWWLVSFGSLFLLVVSLFVAFICLLKTVWEACLFGRFVGWLVIGWLVGWLVVLCDCLEGKDKQGGEGRARLFLCVKCICLFACLLAHRCVVACLLACSFVGLSDCSGSFSLLTVVASSVFHCVLL